VRVVVAQYSPLPLMPCSSHTTFQNWCPSGYRAAC
jgi:hypothetical protein